MGIYSLQVIPIDLFSFSGNTPWSFDDGSGAGWQFENYTFSFNGADIVAATVNDADDVLQDDPGNPEWSGGTWPPHSQVLDQDFTISGTTWPAGTTIDDEYEFDALGDDGLMYRVVALSVIDPGTGQLRVIGLTFDGAFPPDGVTLTSQAGSAQDGQQMDAPICFCAGTRIATPLGPRLVEDLSPGDLVTTEGGKAVPILWKGHRRLASHDLDHHPEFRPIVFAAGALGQGLPERELRLSPQHRVVVRSKIVARMLKSSDQALVAAKHLVGTPGVTVDHAAQEVDYFHLLCATHEVIFSEGARTETLLPGPQAMRSLSPEGRQEIALLFPELADSYLAPAHPILPGRRARKLSERHRQNGMAYC